MNRLCKIIGRFCGAAHDQVEIYKLPIVFHNLCGYDAHSIFQKIKQKHGNIYVIPNNSEWYISFDDGHLKFLDSTQFLSCGLDKLAE